VKAGERYLKFLVCDTAGDVDDSPSEEEWVASPIQFLDKAVERKPKVIVVSFIRISIRERGAFLKLSASQKRNSHTKQCAVLAILSSKHRKVIEELDRMVLGGRRLHELCETDDHLHCEYYQNPSRKS
jgi:hypothetical protein